MRIYQVIAQTIGAREHCEEKGNTEWASKHQEKLDAILEEFPSGSGFDHGTKLDETSTSEKLVFNVDFHHMNEGGMYDGWTQHQVIVTPSLSMGYTFRITGKDRNGIKEYISECFSTALDAMEGELVPA